MEEPLLKDAPCPILRNVDPVQRDDAAADGHGDDDPDGSSPELSDGPDVEAELPARGSAAGAFCTMIVSSRLKVLLLVVPVAVASPLAAVSPPVVFGLNALAVVPLSALMTNATERVAAHAGDTVGALLNVSLGNLVELILL